MSDAAAHSSSPAGAVTGALIRGLTRYSPLIILAVLWEAVARLGLVSGSSLPALSSVAVAWIDLLRSGDLLTNT
ncbi:MAG: ABC transporter permease, partial [Pseudolabrys sp.]